MRMGMMGGQGGGIDGWVHLPCRNMIKTYDDRIAN